mgnify:CR=1 FL=1
MTARGTRPLEAYVLHRYDWSESSLILEVFTRESGRLAVAAKGAKRPHSALRAVLQHFHPIALSWTGRGEVKTLTKAEYMGGMLPLAGDGLLSGFYLNELLVKFVGGGDIEGGLGAIGLDADAARRCSEVLVDTLARTLARIEVPLGILTAVVGAPFFLWLLWRGRHGWN